MGTIPAYRPHAFSITPTDQEPGTAEQSSEQIKASSENVCERVALGFGFTSDWLITWRGFF